MKISSKTIDKLVDIITGNTPKSPYRSGPQLIEFFYDFGERDLYSSGFPARHEYVREKLKRFNGSGEIAAIISSAFDYFDAEGMDPESEADSFNQILSKDGYRLTLEYGVGWMEGNKYVRANPIFKVVQIASSTLATESLRKVSHEGVNEQIVKANERVESGDYAGAIASAYTLVEQLLKLMLAEFSPAYNVNEGDIRALYKDVRLPLGLDPSGDKIEGVLKTILDGFQKLVGGLYEMSNKASDRHARKYNPAIHHAKLAVNAAFALCEFLVDTKLYQESRTK